MGPKYGDKKIYRHRQNRSHKKINLKNRDFATWVYRDLKRKDLIPQ